MSLVLLALAATAAWRGRYPLRSGWPTLLLGLAVPGGVVSGHAAVGVARRGAGSSVESLLASADKAMYADKAHRRGTGASGTESVADAAVTSVSTG